MTVDLRMLTARREFANSFADLARGKRTWQLVAFWCLGLLTVCVASYIRVASSARVVPYLLEVDRVGQVMTAKEAEVRATPEPRGIASQLGRFLRTVRTILPAS